MNTINNVLSVFDGMSCGQIALNNLGIKYENYFSSEIDKHAIKVTQHNFPNTIQLGDVTKVNTKTLCLSELYLYICKKYFNNDIHSLQGIISEYEMLHRINEKQTFAAYFGTQKQIEGGKVQTNSILQINDRIWFFKNKVGDSKGIYDIIRCGERRKTSDQIDVGELCKHSFWWNGNGQSEPGVKEESLNGAYGEKSIGINEREIEKKCYKSICDTGGERSPKAKSIRSISRPCKKNELPECCKENRYSSEVYKKNEYGKSEKRNSIGKVERKLQTDDDNGRTFKDNRNFLFLCEKVQITIVECEWGITIIKGTFKICIGGSPCQGFSFAGKQLNFDDPRSKLFFEFVRLKNELQPKYFLLENVKMKQEYQDIISQQLGVNPILINSSLVSAQNRERLYWTNIQNVVSPTDKHIYIKDILQPELDIDYIDNFKNCVRKNMIGIEISKYVKNSGFAQIPVKSGFQDHKVGITKSPCLRAGNPFCLVETKSGGIRRLTPLECERLQNVPENYTNIVADTHRYSMLGNGWTVGVIEHIFKNICS